MNDAAIGNKLEKILQLTHKIDGHLDKPKPDTANVPADAVAEPQRSKLSPGDIVQIVTAGLLLLTLGVSVLTFIWSVKSNQRSECYIYKD
jgi:hypothetical protein